MLTRRGFGALHFVNLEAYIVIFAVSNFLSTCVPDSQVGMGMIPIRIPLNDSGSLMVLLKII